MDPIADPAAWAAIISMDEIPKWAQALMTLVLGIVGGVVGAVRWAGSVNEKITTLRLYVDEQDRITRHNTNQSLQHEAIRDEARREIWEARLRKLEERMAVVEDRQQAAPMLNEILRRLPRQHHDKTEG